MIYLRKIKTDKEAIALPFWLAPHVGDVVASLTPDGPCVGIWRWYQSNRPDRRNKRVRFNGVKQEVEWL